MGDPDLRCPRLAEFQHLGGPSNGGSAYGLGMFNAQPHSNCLPLVSDFPKGFSRMYRVSLYRTMVLYLLSSMDDWGSPLFRKPPYLNLPKTLPFPLRHQPDLKRSLSSQMSQLSSPTRWFPPDPNKESLWNMISIEHCGNFAQNGNSRMFRFY